MTKHDPDKPKSNRGGARPNSGRPKGSKNRTRLEREAVVGAHIDRLRAGGGQTGKDALERMLKFAEGCAALLQPTTNKQIAQGIAENPDGNWDRFGQWFDRASFLAKELTKYQTPQLRAVAVMAPAPTVEPQAPMIEGSVTRMPNAEDAEQAYLRLIGAAA